jgi:putrescine transport system ATP-binding protein
LLRFDGVSKCFSDVAVLHVSLDIYEGEFFALLGPSGCGKTTLLRLLAGFEAPDEGHPARRRGHRAGAPASAAGQHDVPELCVVPHLSVEGNVAFGLKQEGLPSPTSSEWKACSRWSGSKAWGTASRTSFRRPAPRVALARSLVKQPRVLLLDEPLAALDKKLRGETQFELVRLQEKLGLTFIISPTTSRRR